jgi:hypothetical protein
MFEEIIFNDADGTDNDIEAYERIGFRDCGTSLNWEAPIFYMESNEWATIIAYDDIKDDVRYSVIINYDVTGTDAKHVTISYGKAHKVGPDTSKKITMIGSQYGTGYFVNWVNNEIDS